MDNPKISSNCFKKRMASAKVLGSLNKQQIGEDVLRATACQKQLSFGSIFCRKVTGDFDGARINFYCNWPEVT
jgi:hypothetical protein